MARSLRPVRSTLVAPILPEPMPRTSWPASARVRITPNGMEPSRYPPAATSANVPRAGPTRSCKVIRSPLACVVDDASADDGEQDPALQAASVEGRVLRLGLQ